MYYTIGGASTATAGVDYTSLSGSVTFAANEITASVPVTPLRDQLVEGNETVELWISTDPSYIIDIGAPSSATA